MKTRQGESARVRAALSRERRENRRLRTVIDELQREVRQNGHEQELQFARIAQLQAELDVMTGRA